MLCMETFAARREPRPPNNGLQAGCLHHKNETARREHAEAHFQPRPFFCPVRRGGQGCFLMKIVIDGLDGVTHPTYRNL